ncbi:MAG: hypothetical protein JWR52_2015 [Marmoricola sp.]|nr:hypothetical protein [Marmoricola sp.]
MGKRLRVAAEMLLTVVVVLAMVAGVVRLWHEAHRSDFSRALDVVPAATLRLSFTDWAAVRRRLGVASSDNPSAALVNRLISKGYDSDLSSVSSVDDSAASLQKNFGFSPATMQWEAYAQAPAGAALVARMPDGFDFTSVENDLEAMGFTRPPSKTGVWLGGTDLVAGVDPMLSPEVQYVAVLADKGLIVTSDQESYARTAAAVAEGHGASLASLDSTASLVDKAGEPAAAMVWTRDFACSDLAMSSADQDAQNEADTLVTRAGKITPLTGLVMALGANRNLTVLEGFENDSDARENLRARARLAVGSAPGRGGTFSDDLKLTASRTDGAAVRLEFAPRTPTGYVLSAVNDGPVLFATC